MTEKPGFRTWLKGHLAGLTAPKPSADRPPYLPSPRPRPLTPTASDESSVKLEPQPAECLLFTKLPADLRRDIFVAAFGGRTVHMDLVFDYPLLSAPVERPRKSRNSHHAAIYLRKESYSGREPKVWRWGGSVCHRQHPDSIHPRNTWVWRWGWEGVWHDHCNIGAADACSLYEPDGCHIGIMGFLVSCRQSYLEGIDVLYATNFINIASEPLLLQLPRLIPAQRLSSITALELRIQARVSWDDGTYDLSHLAPIMENIAEACPRLRSLVLSIVIDLRPSRLNADEVLDGCLWPVLDSFYLSMQLRDMRVEVPWGIYEACCNSLRRASPSGPPRLGADGKALRDPIIPWRCFDDKDGDGTPVPSMDARSMANFPKPPTRLPTPGEGMEESAASVGYWLFEGEDNRPIGRSNCGVPRG